MGTDDSSSDDGLKLKDFKDLFSSLKSLKSTGASESPAQRLSRSKSYKKDSEDEWDQVLHELESVQQRDERIERGAKEYTREPEQVEMTDQPNAQKQSHALIAPKQHLLGTYEQKPKGEGHEEDEEPPAEKEEGGEVAIPKQHRLAQLFTP